MPLNKETKPNYSYCVHFQTNSLGKGMKPLPPPPAIDQIVSLLFFYKDGFGIK